MLDETDKTFIRTEIYRIASELIARKASRDEEDAWHDALLKKMSR